MNALATAWANAQSERTDDATIALLDSAYAALIDGGEWPEAIWMEEILQKSAIASYHLTQGGRIPPTPDASAKMSRLYQEVIDRRWVQGGPQQHFSSTHNRDLGQAIAAGYSREN